MFFKNVQQTQGFQDNRLTPQQQAVVNQHNLGYGTYVVFHGDELISHSNSQADALTRAVAVFGQRGQAPNSLAVLKLGVVEIASIPSVFVHRDDQDPSAPSATV